MTMQFLALIALWCGPSNDWQGHVLDTDAEWCKKEIIKCIGPTPTDEKIWKCFGEAGFFKSFSTFRPMTSCTWSGSPVLQECL